MTAVSTSCTDALIPRNAAVNRFASRNAPEKSVPFSYCSIRFSSSTGIRCSVRVSRGTWWPPTPTISV
jgi:hypothetical protein